MAKDIGITFRVTVEQKQALDKIAKKEHTTISMLIRGLTLDLINIYESGNQVDN